RRASSQPRQTNQSSSTLLRPHGRRTRSIRIEQRSGASCALDLPTHSRSSYTLRGCRSRLREAHQSGSQSAFGDAADFVEVDEATLPWVMLCGVIVISGAVVLFEIDPEGIVFGKIIRTYLTIV